MRTHLSVFLFLAAGVVAACGTESTQLGPCNPTVLDCDCPDGSSGLQYCEGASGAYGTCVCDDGGSADVSGGSDAGVVSDGGDSCSSGFCAGVAGAAGTFCDGSELVECVREGACFVEESRTRCATGEFCSDGECTEAASCISDADCPGEQEGAWGECSGYSDACDESGERLRTVTSYACRDEVCVADVQPVTDTVGCDRETDGTVIETGEFGSCVFADDCAESGERTRQDIVCVAGRESSEPRIEVCDRTTQGEPCATGACDGGECLPLPECSPSDPCPAREVGDWGACGGYSNECDETGERTREVTSYSCEAGACESSSTTERDTAGCARETDGVVIAEGEFGECQYDSECAEDGTQIRTDRVCRSGRETSSEVSDSCGRSTDGDVCDGGECAGGECVPVCDPQFEINNAVCSRFSSEGRTLIVCAELVGMDEARFRIRKADGSTFTNAGTMHIRVGERTGDDCPNVSRGSTSFRAGASEVTITIDLIPSGGWTVGSSKQFFPTIAETGGGTCYRYAPEIEITRLCQP